MTKLILKKVGRRQQKHEKITQHARVKYLLTLLDVVFFSWIVIIIVIIIINIF